MGLVRRESPPALGSVDRRFETAVGHTAGQFETD